MQIYSNTPAFGVWVNYNTSVQHIRKSMERLSSGRHSGLDDPAGLAMSHRMQAQFRNSNVSAQNVQNIQAYIRTTDSWMQKIHDIIHRLSELAVASIDGTKTDVDRANLQLEFEQMQQELIRITSNSLARGKFNTRNLFQGGALNMQVGPDAGQLFCATSLRLDARSRQSIGTTHVHFRCGKTAHFLGVDGQPIPRPVDDSSVQPGPEARWSMVMARGGDRYNLLPGQATDGIHVSTVLGAQRAGAILTLAVDHVSRLRAILGAQGSRLHQSLDGLRAYSENILSAESQIRDVDMAMETTHLMKHQIVSQAGTAMLAQANALPEGVLQLIG